MRKLLSFIFCLFVFLTSRAEFVEPSQLLSSASSAYEQGNYAEAAASYQLLADAFGGTPEVYYDLGNAYYKQQMYAKAILNYERCLLRDPSHSDARTNLEMAQLNCVDKIESIQPVIFVTWSNALRDCMSSNQWSFLSIILFLLFITGLFCYAFVRRLAIRKTGFYGAIVAIALCGICMLYAHAQADHQTAADHAIVMAPTVTVRSTPAESGTQLLIIHEGLKVRIRQELSGWSEIELSDGNVGWMPTSMLEVI